ncbi:T-box transcription factor TBX20-like isoform X2 [Corticium candelabrum]|uniref:T-box transcription factor TBX20-like isoform X2 n=1 Tax=Corticium candelabrum TaxID=121492 RepID=UPI002E26821D|nr:T-box transcription factor TBX20-like isoform X2 [Corticium candelabrum]
MEAVALPSHVQESLCKNRELEVPIVHVAITHREINTPPPEEECIVAHQLADAEKLENENVVDGTGIIAVSPPVSESCTNDSTLTDKRQPKLTDETVELNESMDDAFAGVDAKNGDSETEELESASNVDEQPHGNDTHGNIHVTLESKHLWSQFNHIGTEMIITKAGRRMFPAPIVSVKGLEVDANYTVFLDIVPVDKDRYKYMCSKWMVVGKAEKELEPRPRYVHPESPKTGEHWMSQQLSFKKMKLTNNKKNTLGHIVLNSMQKYQPRIHVVKDGEDADDDSKHGVFMFPETVFVAVTAYQNDQITQLKIDNNPFAKAFRDGPQESDLSNLRTQPVPWAHSLYQAPMSPSLTDSLFSGSMRFAQAAGYSPWDIQYMTSTLSPLTPGVQFRQDSLGQWQAGHTMGGSVHSYPSVEEAFPTSYGSTGLRSPAYQVPLTPLTPATVDAYSNYVHAGGLGVSGMPSPTGHCPMPFSSSMDQVKYPSSMMLGSQFKHTSYN